MSETATRSREEDEELQRSTKKVKENHSLGSPQTDTPPPPPIGWEYVLQRKATWRNLWGLRVSF